MVGERTQGFAALAAGVHDQPTAFESVRANGGSARGRR